MRWLAEWAWLGPDLGVQPDVLLEAEDGRFTRIMPGVRGRPGDAGRTGDLRQADEAGDLSVPGGSDVPGRQRGPDEAGALGDRAVPSGLAGRDSAGGAGDLGESGSWAVPVEGAVRLAGLTLPGLVNAHSHAFHRALRGRTHGAGGDFWTWRERMYAVAARLDPDSYHALARANRAELAGAPPQAAPGERR